MIKMPSVQFLRVVLAAGAVGATTLATGYARAAWVMGAQIQPQRTYFTEIEIVFKVPGPPNRLGGAFPTDHEGADQEETEGAQPEVRGERTTSGF